MSDGAGAVTYGYDALGRLLELSRGGDTFTYAYDAAGNVTSRGYPGEPTATYSFDDDGRLASVSKNGAATSYGYDRAENVTQVELPAANGYVETRIYDRAGRVASLEHAKAGVPLSSASYVYDGVGNPTSVTTLTGVATYEYDVLDRLVDVCFAASCPGATDPFIRYAYDAVGNRTTETRPFPLREQGRLGRARQGPPARLQRTDRSRSQGGARGTHREMGRAVSCDHPAPAERLGRIRPLPRLQPPRSAA